MDTQFTIVAPYIALAIVSCGAIYLLYQNHKQRKELRNNQQTIKSLREMTISYDRLCTIWERRFNAMRRRNEYLSQRSVAALTRLPVIYQRKGQ